MAPPKPVSPPPGAGTFCGNLFFVHAPSLAMLVWHRRPRRWLFRAGHGHGDFHACHHERSPTELAREGAVERSMYLVFCFEFPSVLLTANGQLLMADFQRRQAQPKITRPVPRRGSVGQGQMPRKLSIRNGTLLPLARAQQSGVPIKHFHGVVPRLNGAYREIKGLLSLRSFLVAPIRRDTN